MIMAEVVVGGELSRRRTIYLSREMCKVVGTYCTCDVPTPEARIVKVPSK